MSDRDTLHARLVDDDPSVRATAARALGKHGDGRDVAALMARLTDPEPMVRGMVAAALGRLGSAAQEAVPALVAMLEDPVVPVRFWVADALGTIGQDTPRVRQGLERLATLDAPMAKAARHAATRALALLDRAESHGP